MNATRKVRGPAAALALLWAFVAVPAHADSVVTDSGSGFGRILLTLSPTAHAKAAMAGGVVTISFDRKVAIDPAQVAKNFSAYVSSARLDPDGKTLRLALAQDAHLHTTASMDRIAVDLVPDSFNGTPPRSSAAAADAGDGRGTCASGTARRPRRRLCEFLAHRFRLAARGAV